LKVVQDGVVKEEYNGLTIGRGARGVDRVVNERSETIRVKIQPVSGMSVAERMPAPGTYAVEPVPPSAAAAQVTAQQIEGSETSRTGYQGLAIADDVTIVAVPDLVTVSLREDGTLDDEVYLAAQGRLVDWCELTGTRTGVRRSARTAPSARRTTPIW
jgi:hypothetical protein